MPSNSHRPQRLLTWVGGRYRHRELDTPTILAGLRGDGLPVQGCVIGRLGRTRSAKAGLAVVRFVSEVGLSVACAVPTLAERWVGNYCSLRRCKDRLAAVEVGPTPWSYQAHTMLLLAVHDVLAPVV